MHLPRIMIAAPASGSGKTMITCGLLQALKERGKNPASFKCGPDYIDPMFHSRVIGTPSRNLDTFFTDDQTTRYLFARSAAEAGISVLEGVMGFYDGLGGITPKASSFDLARVTETPVVLVVDAKGMSLSLIPFLKGFVEYQRTAATGIYSGRDREKTDCASGCSDSRIRGVILNRVTAMTYQLLKPLIEEQTGLTALGYVPVLEACRVESRHLGLVTPDEIADLQQRVATLARELEKTVDMEALLSLADRALDYEELQEPAVLQTLCDSAPEYGISKEPRELQPFVDSTSGYDKLQQSMGLQGECCPADGEGHTISIAVARDEAFCFYYQDNLDLLEQLGAQLVFFSPLHDRTLPEDCCGLILGGGYPELYAGALSENVQMRELIREAVKKGMPYLAECGGFMYLHETMQDMEGRPYPMVGAVAGESYRTKRLGRFGYITLQTGEQQLLLPGEEIRGHEFHYFDSTDCGTDYHAVKPVTGRSWDCIHGTKQSAAGYPHLYYWSNPRFAARFVEAARSYGENMGSDNDRN